MPLIVLAGNPNVGKSTLFNALTGSDQHTGNWPGKTVAVAQGTAHYRGAEYRWVDLPGAYSLLSCSPEEAVTAEFLEEGAADCVVAVCDATAMERSLIFVLQVLSRCRSAVVCVNLMDEARREDIRVDTALLEQALGVPVVLTAAGRSEGLDALQETVRQVCEGFLPCAPPPPPSGDPEEQTRSFVLQAEAIAQKSVSAPAARRSAAKADAILLHPLWGGVVMLFLLTGVFWLTMQGANYPSAGLQWCFDRLRSLLASLLRPLPPWCSDLLLSGIYDTTAGVVAVMLPPMAIFFPLFTLLEQLGYLPRVAFLLDRPFARSGACGKQALTLCMGFGCNAVGVTGCRIIASPRERLMAILTNAFVPCNGRFPALFLLIGLTVSGAALSALAMTVCLLLSIAMTLLADRLLGRTVLRGESSSFVLELPPYRRPRWGQVILRSLLDRTLCVLGRAVSVAAPMGLVIWVLANVRLGSTSLLCGLARLLETPGLFLGMNGAVLTAFLLGSPANELVLPIAAMILTAGGSVLQTSEAATAQLLTFTGWTWQQSVCTAVFFLFHWPCTTTLLTIHKETGSKKWTLLAALLPTAFGILLCTGLHLLLRLF